MIWLYIAAAVAVLYLLFMFNLILPGRAGKAKPMLERLKGVNFAHRGLHSRDNSIPENSMPAFRAALEKGYGIELDVRLSLDGELFVFHDTELDRATECDDWADGLTYEKLSALRLFGTDERIPRLSEVLELIDGKVPLLIEVKRSTRTTYLCRKLSAMLKDYKGDYAVISFDPTVLSWFRKNEKTVPRGLLVAPSKAMDNADNPVTSFLGSRVFGNYLCRAQILVCSKGPRTLNAKIAAKLSPALFVWTVRDGDDISSFEKKNDSVIFEYYTPAPKTRKGK